MNVNEWFENGCDYQAGVLLYGQLKGHSPNLLRLFLKKESAKNESKLHYELSKHKDKEVIQMPVATTPTKSKSKPVKTEKATAAAPVKPEGSKQGFYRLNELHPDLHELSIEQRNNFQLVVSAHQRLTRLHASEEGEALKLQLQIEELFDAIDTAQKVLDHYVKHKVVLKTESRTYDDMNAAQLVQARRNKRTSVTKYRKKVESLQGESPDSKSEQNKHAVELQRANEKLLKHEMDLRKLDELIGNYE